MNENINKKFDVKNFDYDKCYEEVKENASKNINIIVRSYRRWQKQPYKRLLRV